MDILDTTSHSNAIITDLVKIAEKKGAAEGSTPKTIAAGINLITNTLSGNEEAKSLVIVRALDELVNAVGSGGGGSSDFSTAEVVVNSELGNIQYLNIVSVLDGQINALITNNFIMMMDSTVTYQVPLYKGLCIWSTAPGWNYNISVTGDITFEQGRIMIRGDGTITIS